MEEHVTGDVTASTVSTSGGLRLTCESVLCLAVIDLNQVRGGTYDEEKGQDLLLNLASSYLRDSSASLYSDKIGGSETNMTSRDGNLGCSGHNPGSNLNCQVTGFKCSGQIITMNLFKTHGVYRCSFADGRSNRIILEFIATELLATVHSVFAPNQLYLLVKQQYCHGEEDSFVAVFLKFQSFDEAKIVQEMLSFVGKLPKATDSICFSSEETKERRKFSNEVAFVKRLDKEESTTNEILSDSNELKKTSSYNRQTQINDELSNGSDRNGLSTVLSFRAEKEPNKSHFDYSSVGIAVSESSSTNVESKPDTSKLEFQMTLIERDIGKNDLSSQNNSKPRYLDMTLRTEKRNSEKSEVSNCFHSHKEPTLYSHENYNYQASDGKYIKMSSPSNISSESSENQYSTKAKGASYCSATQPYVTGDYKSHTYENDQFLDMVNYRYDRTTSDDSSWDDESHASSKSSITPPLPPKSEAILKSLTKKEPNKFARSFGNILSTNLHDTSEPLYGSAKSLDLHTSHHNTSFSSNFALPSQTNWTKDVEEEEHFVGQLMHEVMKYRSNDEVSGQIKQILKNHNEILSVLHGIDKVELLKTFFKNFRSMSPTYVRVIDFLTVDAPRSGMNHAIIKRIVSEQKLLQNCFYSDTELMRMKEVVIQEMSNCVSKVVDRQSLWMIDQDKVDLMQCGDILVKGNLQLLNRKLESSIFVVLMTHVIILAKRNTYEYLNHALTKKISYVQEIPDRLEFIVTIDAKSSVGKFHFRSSQVECFDLWVCNLRTIARNNNTNYGSH